jgi:hypothetical protein
VRAARVGPQFPALQAMRCAPSPPGVWCLVSGVWCLVSGSPRLFGSQLSPLSGAAGHQHHRALLAHVAHAKAHGGGVAPQLGERVLRGEQSRRGVVSHGLAGAGGVGGGGGGAGGAPGAGGRVGKGGGCMASGRWRWGAVCKNKRREEESPRGRSLAHPHTRTRAEGSQSRRRRGVSHGGGSQSRRAAEPLAWKPSRSISMNGPIARAPPVAAQTR